MSAEPIVANVSTTVNVGIKFEGKANLIIEGDVVRAVFSLTNPDIKARTQNYTWEATTDRKLFTDDQQIIEWFNASMASFRSRRWMFLAGEMARFHSDNANQWLDMMKVEEIDMRDIVKKHARETEKGLHAALHLQGLGNFSAWTRLDLIRVIRAAFAKLPPRERNYEGVASWMKPLYPNTAPASGEVLRQLVRRH